MEHREINVGGVLRTPISGPGRAERRPERLTTKEAKRTIRNSGKQEGRQGSLTTKTQRARSGSAGLRDCASAGVRDCASAGLRCACPTRTRQIRIPNFEIRNKHKGPKRSRLVSVLLVSWERGVRSKWSAFGERLPHSDLVLIWVAAGANVGGSLRLPIREEKRAHSEREEIGVRRTPPTFNSLVPRRFRAFDH